MGPEEMGRDGEWFMEQFRRHSCPALYVLEMETGLGKSYSDQYSSHWYDTA